MAPWRCSVTGGNGIQRKATSAENPKAWIVATLEFLGHNGGGIRDERANTHPRALFIVADHAGLGNPQNEVDSDSPVHRDRNGIEIRFLSEKVRKR